MRTGDQHPCEYATLKFEIDKIVQTLAVNDISGVYFIGGIPMRVRGTNEQVIAPKPLVAVISSIRKALAPIQLRHAIKKQSEKLLNEIEIEYIEPQLNQDESSSQSVGV